MGSRVRDPRNPVPGLIVRDARPSDVPFIAEHIRSEDRAECFAASGLQPIDAIGRGFAASESCHTVVFEGRPAAIFGVVPSSEVTNPKLGAVWLLGTDDIRIFSRQFIEHSKFWIDELANGYDLIGNVVDARNTVHIEWLKWAGFKFIQRHEKYGHLGLPFLEFVKATD